MLREEELEDKLSVTEVNKIQECSNYNLVVISQRSNWNTAG